MFHKEGFFIIITTFILCAASALLAEYFVGYKPIRIALQLGTLVVLILVLQFFRNPSRNTVLNANHILSPVDGKIVIIEEVYEKEYFKDQRLQVSVFMSPINVHVTRYPMSGKINFSKYHPGKYLVAWHPKSSELNERTTIVVENDTFGEVLYRQIAGAGDSVVQGTDAGFIKFGSRVDIFLPAGTPVEVALNQVVRGGETVITSK